VTRVAIGVDEHTGRVIATSAVPTIVRGVPLRLRTVSVAVNRPSFLFNPTNCGPLATNSALTSTLGGTQVTSSPFQVSNCSALPFKPSFKVATSTKVSKANGAGLKVNVAQGPHQANIRSVFTQLPVQLPSRLTTLQKACTQATFEANPASCPAASNVGTATAVTPVLPGSLTGPAYLVSHAAEAFPNLAVVLQDGGVRVILEGTTDIKKGITTSTFASVPDVPVSSFALNLPTGPHSALAAFGNLCAHGLFMPTVITAQSGAVFKQKTKIAVAGCGVRIVRKRVRGHTLLITIQTPGAGRVTVTGRNLKTVKRSVRKAARTTLRVRIARAGVSALKRRHPPEDQAARPVRSAPEGRIALERLGDRDRQALAARRALSGWPPCCRGERRGPAEIVARAIVYRCASECGDSKRTPAAAWRRQPSRWP